MVDRKVSDKILENKGKEEGILGLGSILVEKILGDYETVRLPVKE